ncbi:hypothetical protein R6Z07F_011341 [Ovis aries]
MAGTRAGCPAERTGISPGPEACGLTGSCHRAKDTGLGANSLNLNLSSAANGQVMPSIPFSPTTHVAGVTGPGGDGEFMALPQSPPSELQSQFSLHSATCREVLHS